MKRTKINSSNVHSHAHGENGLEVVFHERTCKNRANKRDDACDCDGAGGHYQYPTVTAEEYSALCAAESFGSHFMTHIRHAKDDQGKIKHPATFIPADAGEVPA
jgi:KTSC domain-containing protein